jgi:hypothetical protein
MHKNIHTPVFKVTGSLLKYDVKNAKDTIPKEKPIIREGHISPPVPKTTYSTPLINIKDIGIAAIYGKNEPLSLNHSILTGAYI